MASTLSSVAVSSVEPATERVTITAAPKTLDHRIWQITIIRLPANLHACRLPAACVCCALQAWRILDFLVNYPESAHMLTWLLDEPGIPTDYRHMEGALFDWPILAVS